MNISEWLEATSLRKATSAEDKAARQAERDRVLSKAGTTLATLKVAKSRGYVGRDLRQRLSDATKGEKNFIDPPHC